MPSTPRPTWPIVRRASFVSLGIAARFASIVILSGGAAPAADSPARIAFLSDDRARDERNAEQKNDWDAYIPELLDELGLRADPLAPDRLGDAAALAPFDTILLGRVAPGRLPDGAPSVLSDWVARGGTLVLFATAGLDDLAGITAHGALPPGADEFACTASFELASNDLTRDIHSPLAPQQKLLIFSETRLIEPSNAVELARLFDGQGTDTGRSAITMRTLGRGRVFHFAFHPPQTVWVLHQGRPVDRDYDGDNILRRSDAIVIRPHAIEVAYADELLLVLQNMIATRPHVFAHALPPDANGAIPDALFHWGGDDEGDSKGIQLFASNWMKAHGLPYHINAMPRADGTFGLSGNDAARILENGHELSIHFNFVDQFPPGSHFTREQLLDQDAAYERHFGRQWVCSVNHWTRWTGWTEPIRWMREAGGQADNTFVHCGSPPSNPTNRMGFSFGTAFPFWFYDDWTGKNARIDFLELPITAYECGYVGQESPDFEMIHKVVDTAAHYHQTMNMFFHPVYITNFPHCRAAIEAMLDYMEKKKIRPLHMGNDALCAWWRARSRITIRDVVVDDSALTFSYTCDHPTGWIAKIPVGRHSGLAARVSGADTSFLTESRFGRNWMLVALPKGQHSVALGWSE